MENFEKKTREELIALIKELSRKNIELKKNIYSKYFSPLINLSDDDYELLVDQETDAVFKGNQQGDFILFNEFASKLTGYSEDELKKMNITHLFSESQLFQKPLRFDLLMKGQSVKNRRYIKTKEGKDIPVEMTSKKLSDGSLVCIMHDISKEEKLRKALKESEGKFREIFNNAADIMLIFKINKKLPPVITDANNAALQILGYEKNELSGKNIFEIFTEKNKEKFEIFSKELEQDKKVSFISEHITKDGTVFPAEISAKIVRLGSEEYIHTVSRDISERTKAEDALKKSEEKYRLLFELLPYGGEIVNTEGIILDISPGTAKMLNYTKEELAGKHLSKIIHKEDTILYKKNFPLLLKGKRQSAEVRMIKKDGSEIFVIRAGQPVRDENGNVKYILTLSVDITERKKIEKKLLEKNKEFEAQNEEYYTLNDELKETSRKLLALNEELLIAKEKAEESSRLKSAFLSNMSHEIRTPMNGILGFAQLLNTPDITKEKIKEYTEIITKSGNHLLNIINDIIDISKLDAGEFKVHKTPVNIDNLLREMYSFFHSYKTEKQQYHIKLILKTPDKKKNTVICTDETRLKQVLSNLLSNALKFTENGYVEFGYTTDKNNVNFYVKDTGIGISKDKVNDIFERFNQAAVNTEKLYGGTGLGLSISKSCIQLLGGSIWVESKIGKGSTFSFSIPYKKAKENPSKQKTKQKINLKGKRVLIVEDDPMNYAYLSEVLGDLELELHHVNNAVKAVEIVKDIDFDLVLMDIQLPGKDGNYAASEIKKTFPNLPVIAQSAYAFENEKQISLQAGCDDYITKPIKKDTLIGTLKKYIN